MKKVEGGVTAAEGFQAASTAAGIKYKDRTDMAMIYSTEPCAVAGTFTTNVVKAAPVKWDKDIVKNSAFAQAVVVNAGIANACTGTEGLGYCKDTAKKTSELMDIPEDAVLVASTGVIGKQLPIDRICAGVEQMSKKLSGDLTSGHNAALAIMTTDTHEKEAAVEVELSGKKVTIGGMCKGSGMIHPNMCTMLSFITTDAAISKEMLQEALSSTVTDTYNMISVDGDTSTNDTCLVLAGDGEGATALFEVKVVHAASKEDAVILSKSVVTSSLTKAAIFGHDANWGRILCALGYSGVEFDPEQVDLYFESAAGKLMIIKDGVAVDYSEEEATKILSEKEVTAIADMKMGEACATAWGCDLTYDYIKINADYRS